MRKFTHCSSVRVLIVSKSRLISGTRHVVHSEDKTSLYKILIEVTCNHLEEIGVRGRVLRRPPVADSKGRQNEYFI